MKLSIACVTRMALIVGYFLAQQHCGMQVARPIGWLDQIQISRSASWLKSNCVSEKSSIAASLKLPPTDWLSLTRMGFTLKPILPCAACLAIPMKNSLAYTPVLLPFQDLSTL